MPCFANRLFDSKSCREVYSKILKTLNPKLLKSYKALKPNHPKRATCLPWAAAAAVTGAPTPRVAELGFGAHEALRVLEKASRGF